MLRSISHSHIKPRIIATKVNSGSPSSFVGIGDAVPTSAADGKVALALTEPFRRACVGVASPEVGAADGAYAIIETLGAVGGITNQKLDSSGTGEAGILHALTLGWDAACTDDVGSRYHTLKTTRNHARLELFKVTGHATTSAINIGSYNATLTRNDPGDYTLTFKRSFCSAPVVVGTVVGGGSLAVVSTAVNAVRVITYAATTPFAAAEKVFYLACLGWDTANAPAKMKRSLRTSQVAPRLLAFRIANSAGTPSISIGGTDAAITDEGVGDYTLTFAKPFAREPLVLVTGNACRATLQAAASASATRVQLFAADGSTAADNDCDVLVFGYDELVER